MNTAATSTSGDYGTAFPNSHKVYDEATVATPHGPLTIRVPAREVALSRGEAAVRLYDTSGPGGQNVRDGLPRLRESWVQPRRGADCVTQLHYARRGEITPEMEFIAVREGLPAEFVRSEVARGLNGSRCGAQVPPLWVGLAAERIATVLLDG